MDQRFAVGEGLRFPYSFQNRNKGFCSPFSNQSISNPERKDIFRFRYTSEKRHQLSPVIPIEVIFKLRYTQTFFGINVSHKNSLNCVPIILGKPV